MTDGRLMGVIRELNGTAYLDNALKQNLTALEKELKDLNNTLHQLRRGLENYLTAGLAGKLVFLGKYYVNKHMKSKLTNENYFIPKNALFCFVVFSAKSLHLELGYWIILTNSQIDI